MTQIKHLSKTIVSIICVVSTSSLTAQIYQQDNFILRLKSGVDITVQRGADRLFEYGISEIVALNDRYNVVRMEKIFVDEIGNHLALYYRVWFAESRSDIVQVSNSYQSLTAVESVELQD